MTSNLCDWKTAWRKLKLRRLSRFKSCISFFRGVNDMDKNEANEDSFGLEVVLTDSDKSAPWCPHGEFRCAGLSPPNSTWNIRCIQCLCLTVISFVLFPFFKKKNKPTTTTTTTKHLYLQVLLYFLRKRAKDKGPAGGFMPVQHAETGRTAIFSSGRMKRHVVTDFS